MSDQGLTVDELIAKLEEAEREYGSSLLVAFETREERRARLVKAVLTDHLSNGDPVVVLRAD